MRADCGQWMIRCLTASIVRRACIIAAAIQDSAEKQWSIHACNVNVTLACSTLFLHHPVVTLALIVVAGVLLCTSSCTDFFAGTCTGISSSRGVSRMSLRLAPFQPTLIFYDGIVAILLIFLPELQNVGLH